MIYASLFELSSGTDLLKRLNQRGLTKEYVDKEDKRSKRLTLTSKGERVVAICYQRIVQNARMLLLDIEPDDKLLAIELLKGIEMKFSLLWPQHKGKDFQKVYASLIKR